MIRPPRVLLLRARISSHNPFQDLQQVTEEVDIDQMRKLGDALEGRGKQRCWRGMLEYPEIEDKEQLERLRLLEDGCR